MSPVVLRLNSKLDRARLAEAYARHGVVQVPDVFELDAAELVTRILETSVPWSLAYYGADQQPKSIPLADLRALPPEVFQREMQELLKRSGAAYGFLYMNYGMISAYLAGTDVEHPIHRLTEFINSEEFLSFGREITGESRVLKADAQATLYRPNDYIGLHEDQNHEGVQRVAAYTLGFTRRWRSDWGGQLMFHDPSNGDVTHGFAPRWNTLTLFKVPRLHSVAPVAPYAERPRLSVVGWLRNDP